ncbi:MAG: hypothetical protein OJF51_003053 [Nitrospira sp.]|nr:MAG: hypothetical protein OJF51_003053 [Nitrospira sp.]
MAGCSKWPSCKTEAEIFEDVQKGLLARPQRCEDPRRTLRYVEGLSE